MEYARTLCISTLLSPLLTANRSASLRVQRIEDARWVGAPLRRRCPFPALPTDARPLCSAPLRSLPFPVLPPVLLQVLVWGAAVALFYQFVYVPDKAARDAAKRPPIVLDSTTDRLGKGGPAARRAAAAETDRMRREADARGAAAEAAAAAKRDGGGEGGAAPPAPPPR